MKRKAQGRPGALKESCLYWRSPLPCIPLPRARASLEKAGMRGWLTFGGGSRAGAATNTLNKKITSTQRHKQVRSRTHSARTLLRLPLSASLFCQSGWFFICDPQQGFSISWMGNTRRLVKHNWLIYWVAGAEVGGILDAPLRSHREIVEQEQRACSENNRGEIPLS